MNSAHAIRDPFHSSTVFIYYAWDQRSAPAALVGILAHIENTNQDHCLLAGGVYTDVNCAIGIKGTSSFVNNMAGTYGGEIPIGNRSCSAGVVATWRMTGTIQAQKLGC